ncbi:TPA: hypothetical protein N0F65_005338 [Lagenidium giganteum]|uniref:Transposase n=1 Tax=Lagenidium giganteum TaxID=4803 RepID=A0AAV2YV53_9STRA|nr:TPA: hypothetical protein N0F65_005338 [Lagenidium giganteum]
MEGLTSKCAARGLPRANPRTSQAAKIHASMTKAMVWTKLSTYIAEHVKPEIVQMANDNDHEVVFTPPYHSDLQPIEMVWAIVIGECGRAYTNNTTFAEVKENLLRAFAALGIYWVPQTRPIQFQKMICDFYSFQFLYTTVTQFQYLL